MQNPFNPSREPVRRYVLALALINLVAAFGLHLSAEQMAALTTMVGIYFGQDVRSRVMPVETDTPVEVITEG